MSHFDKLKFIIVIYSRTEVIPIFVFEYLFYWFLGQDVLRLAE